MVEKNHTGPYYRVQASFMYGVVRVCALRGGQHGGSGSQLVDYLEYFFRKLLRLILLSSLGILLKIGSAASVESGRNTLWV